MLEPSLALPCHPPPAFRPPHPPKHAAASPIFTAQGMSAQLARSGAWLKPARQRCDGQISAAAQAPTRDGARAKGEFTLEVRPDLAVFKESADALERAWEAPARAEHARRHRCRLSAHKKVATLLCHEQRPTQRLYCRHASTGRPAESRPHSASLRPVQERHTAPRQPLQALTEPGKAGRRFTAGKPKRARREAPQRQQQQQQQVSLLCHPRVVCTAFAEPSTSQACTAPCTHGQCSEAVSVLQDTGSLNAELKALLRNLDEQEAAELNALEEGNKEPAAAHASASRAARQPAGIGRTVEPISVSREQQSSQQRGRTGPLQAGGQAEDSHGAVEAEAPAWAAPSPAAYSQAATVPPAAQQQRPAIQLKAAAHTATDIEQQQQQQRMANELSGRPASPAASMTSEADAAQPRLRPEPAPRWQQSGDVWNAQPVQAEPQPAAAPAAEPQLQRQRLANQQPVPGTTRRSTASTPARSSQAQVSRTAADTEVWDAWLVQAEPQPAAAGAEAQLAQHQPPSRQQPLPDTADSSSVPANDTAASAERTQQSYTAASQQAADGQAGRPQSDAGQPQGAQLAGASLTPQAGSHPCCFCRMCTAPALACSSNITCSAEVSNVRT